MTSDAERNRADSSDLRHLVESPQPGLFVEFWQFLRHNRKWWLLPFLLALLMLGVLAVLGGTGLAPFVYPFA